MAQVDAPGLVGDERVGPAFERESVAPIGPDHAAEPVLGFQDGQLDRPAQTSDRS